MILNKGSHPVKHDRSSPRYVAVLLHAATAAAVSAFRRAFEPPGTNRPSVQHIKVRPDLQCYRANRTLCRRNVTNDGTLRRVSKLYSVNLGPRSDREQSKPRRVTDSS